MNAAVSAGPWTLAFRRLRRDRAAVAFGVLLVFLLGAFFAAPLYASEIAGTTPSENHLTDQVTADGKQVDVVSLDVIVAWLDPRIRGTGLPS